MENQNIVSTDKGIERLIQQVYSTCDVDNKDAVPVSELLDFINKPGCVFELAELKKKLDPDDKNPSVTCTTFVRSVTEWARSHDVAMHAFNIDKYCDQAESSIDGNKNDDDERVKELEHKNKQLSSELEYVKAQLSSAEENHDVVQTEKDRILQKLLKTERLNNELRSTKSENSEFIEVVSEHEKRIHQLKKSLDVADKTIAALKENETKFKEEKKHLNDKINSLRNRESVHTQVIKELELELRNKEQQFLTIMDSNLALQMQLSEQEHHVTHYIECNKILKNQIANFESLIRDHELRFTILKTSFTSIISSPKAETPGRKILANILNFNSPKLLNNLANPVSPNLSSPLCGVVDYDRIEKEQEDCLSILNNSDVICNNNESCLKVSFTCDTSLCDEMLLADQEYHKNDCEHIIRKLTIEVEELEEAFKKANDKIELLNGEIGELKISNDKCKMENQSLLYSLSEEVKTKDVLHAEMVLLRETIDNRKTGNFGKMEIKLEKRDSHIEMLNGLLKAEKEISQRLQYERTTLIELNAKKKRIVEDRLQEARRKISILTNGSFEISRDVVNVKLELSRLKADFLVVSDYFNEIVENINGFFGNFFEMVLKNEVRDERSVFELVVNSELNRLQVIDCDSNTDCYLQTVKAFKKDITTIEDRYKYLRTTYDERQGLVSKEFLKLDLMLNSLKLCLSRNLLVDCVQQLKTLKEVCEDNVELAINYGALCHEQRYLKHLNLAITQTTCVSEKLSKLSKKTPKSRRRLCGCRCVFFVIVILVFCLATLLYFNNPLYIKKSYLDVPPPT